MYSLLILIFFQLRFLLHISHASLNNGTIYVTFVHCTGTQLIKKNMRIILQIWK